MASNNNSFGRQKFVNSDFNNYSHVNGNVWVNIAVLSILGIPAMNFGALTRIFNGDSVNKAVSQSVIVVVRDSWLTWAPIANWEADFPEGPLRVTAVARGRVNMVISGFNVQFIRANYWVNFY